MQQPYPDQPPVSPAAESTAPINAVQLWQLALTQLELQVLRPSYETFLRDTVGLRLDGNRLVVGAASDWATEYLSLKLRRTVQQVLGDVAGTPVEVSFEVLGAPGPPASPIVLPSQEPALATAIPSPLASKADPRYTPPRLNERYTFDTFVEGENNRLAFAACQGAVERPGITYNPLFIYGGVGLGKTHLLHAMGHVLLTRGLMVMYVTSEQFTNDFVSAIREGRNDEFRSRYRSADLLLIDDIQFIAGKEGTMEEFFHTFNDLHSHGRQIVMTSDQPPKRVSGLQDRLISRFEWGLIADIQPPSPELRLAILQKKARALGRPVPEDVLAFIAERVQDNVRELEGSLNRISAYSDLTGTPITLDLAWKAFGQAPPITRRRAPQPEDVLDAVAAYFQLRPAQLAGQGRDKRLAHARQLAMYLLREDVGLPLTEIGRILGKRDHTTIMYGCRKVDEARVSDPELRQQLSELRAAAAGT